MIIMKVVKANALETVRRAATEEIMMEIKIMTMIWLIIRISKLIARIRMVLMLTKMSIVAVRMIIKVVMLLPKEMVVNSRKEKKCP